MYEFHGWATIHESLYEVDEGNLHKIVDTIQYHIKNLNWVSGMIGLKWINGSPFFYVAGQPNHKSQDVDEVFETYKLIGKLAPGSYGVLYARNDEDEEGYDNAFRVYVLSRGNLVVHDDTFLSPCIPVIEDPEP